MFRKGSSFCFLHDINIMCMLTYNSCGYEDTNIGHGITCSKYNIADGMRQMFDPFERVARAHHVCPCCERSFSAEEEDEFVKKVCYT